MGLRQVRISPLRKSPLGALDYIRDLRPARNGVRSAICTAIHPELLMFVMSQKQTSDVVFGMSALPPKAVFAGRDRPQSARSEVAVITSVELIVQPDTHDFVDEARK